LECGTPHAPLFAVSRKEKKSDAPFPPEKKNHACLKEAAQSCKGCDLYRNATQAVMGEGNLHARIVFVGEQPGDQEDRQGHPFVGPAGGILNRALEEAGIDRTETYVTNAVKHFKWKPTYGKRRIHQKPSTSEIQACKPWLLAELELIGPQIVVCMGATAVQSVFNKSLRIGDLRGKRHETDLCSATFVTVHPSSLLRAPDSETRKREYLRFVHDLKAIKLYLDRHAPPREKPGKAA
jgi:DNA polymerase